MPLNDADHVGSFNLRRKYPFEHLGVLYRFNTNFRQSYIDGELLIYALVEIFSFGMLSKFYKNMKNSDKKVVAKSSGVGHSYLESWNKRIPLKQLEYAHFIE